MNLPLIIGHRGAAGHAPENTLLSVEKGIQLGAGMIEIDVYAVENELVVIHDDTLERTTNGSGFVMDRSLSYLRSLDAGAGQKIPFLHEVIGLVDRRVGVNIELKGPGTAEPVAKLIRNYIDSGWDYSQFLVSSFDHRELQKIQSIDKNIRIGILIYGAPLYFLQFSHLLNAFSVHFSMDFIDQNLVDAARSQQFRVFVYTVNALSEYERLHSLQIDGIFSDFPDIFTNLK